MKKKLIAIALISVIIGLFAYGCSNDKKSGNDAHKYVIQGKVIEIIEEKKILVEITKDRGGYKKGEKLIIKYNNIDAEIIQGESEQILNDYKIQLNDEISAQYGDIGKLDGYDYLETNTIGKYVFLDETEK